MYIRKTIKLDPNRPKATCPICNKRPVEVIRGKHKNKCEHCRRPSRIISRDDYNKVFIEQDGKCLICGKHQSELEKGLAVDHDHITGKVRGLLCFHCNIGLGMFRDDITLLTNAINYLVKIDK